MTQHDVLEDLLAGLEDDMARQQRRLADLRAGIARPVPAPAGDTAGVEEVHGVERVRERIAELSFFARSSVRAVQPARPSSPESAAAARPLDARNVRRGLSVRVVHDAALADDAAATAHLHAIAATGTDVRLLPGPLERLIVLDGRVAVLPLDPSDSARGALVVHCPGTVAALCALFDQTWARAGELPGTTPGPGPDPEDAAVLRLLAQGCTDDVTARRVGMSGRVVRRRVARLMDELDAGSRFAAGAAAARRGWI